MTAAGAEVRIELNDAVVDGSNDGAAELNEPESEFELNEKRAAGAEVFKPKELKSAAGASVEVVLNVFTPRKVGEALDPKPVLLNPPRVGEELNPSNDDGDAEVRNELNWDNVGSAVEPNEVEKAGAAVEPNEEENAGPALEPNDEENAGALVVLYVVGAPVVLYVVGTAVVLGAKLGAAVEPKVLPNVLNDGLAAEDPKVLYEIGAAFVVKVLDGIAADDPKVLNEAGAAVEPKVLNEGNDGAAVVNASNPLNGDAVVPKVLKELKSRGAAVDPI